MAQYKVNCVVSPDDGKDGMFWRDGERWLRDKGNEYRMAQLAPTLEAKWMMAHKYLAELVAEHALSEAKPLAGRAPIVPKSASES